MMLSLVWNGGRLGNQLVLAMHCIAISIEKECIVILWDLGKALGQRLPIPIVFYKGKRLPGYIKSGKGPVVQSASRSRLVIWFRVAIHVMARVLGGGAWSSDGDAVYFGFTHPGIKRFAEIVDLEEVMEVESEKAYISLWGYSYRSYSLVRKHRERVFESLRLMLSEEQCLTACGGARMLFIHARLTDFAHTFPQLVLGTSDWCSRILDAIERYKVDCITISSDDERASRSIIDQLGDMTPIRIMLSRSSAPNKSLQPMIREINHSCLVMGNYSTLSVCVAQLYGKDYLGQSKEGSSYIKNEDIVDHPIVRCYC